MIHEVKSYGRDVLTWFTLEDMMATENQFRDKMIRPFLDNNGSFYFIKEALALRGLPDIMGCCNGRFFALEVKKSESEATKDIGRIVLQKVILERIKEAGGLSTLVFPENWLEVKKSLEDLQKQIFVPSIS